MSNFMQNSAPLGKHYRPPTLRRSASPGQPEHPSRGPAKRPRQRTRSYRGLFLSIDAKRRFEKLSRTGYVDEDALHGLEALEGGPWRQHSKKIETETVPVSSLSPSDTRGMHGYYKKVVHLVNDASKMPPPAPRLAVCTGRASGYRPRAARCMAEPQCRLVLWA